MASAEFHKVLLASLEQMIEPLAGAKEDPETLAGWLIDLGFPLPSVVATQQIAAAASMAVDAVDALSAAADGIDSVVELAEFLAGVAGAVDAIRSFADAVPALAGAEAVSPGTVAKRTLQRLAVEALDHAHPAIVPSLVALGLADRWRGADLASASSGTNKLLTREFVDLALERLPHLLVDPAATLRTLYAPNGFATDQETLAAADRLMPALGQVATALGLRALYGSDTIALTRSADDRSARGALLLTFMSDNGTATAGAGVSLVSAAGEGPGVAIAPFGEVDLTTEVGPWLVQVVAKATIQALLFGRTGVRLFGADGANFGASLALTPKPDALPLLIGVPKGTRIEIPPIAARAYLDASLAAPDAGAEVTVTGLKLVIAASDGDGFLASVLPQTPIALSLDVTFGASVKRSFYIEGGVGTSYKRVLHETIGPIHIESIALELSVADGAIVLTVSGDGSLEIGPLNASVKGIGFRITTLLGQPGNLGNADLALAFKPPVGIGLSIDSGAIVGGGFLDFDKPNERYSGILGLRFGKIGLTAIALITTKMPDGSKGFSLMANIGVTFDPTIQIAMGFWASGFGGLLGVNRTMNVDALRAGLKSRTLDSILFPDPTTLVLNAPKIISDSMAVFPPRAGRYVIGPMVQGGWGPGIVKFELGIFMEFPSPIRFVLLGQVVAALPNPDDAIVVIRQDILGVIEPEKKQLTFQATLFDSRILDFPLTGDTACLVRWGDEPEFVMSLGGFHPKFPIPAPAEIFGGMDRLKLNLSSGSDIQLSCEAYQALTTNSLQFGARVDVRASGYGAKVKGYVSFDALIYFSPFAFEASVGAGVQVKYSGFSFEVDLAFVLSGPTPWNTRGKIFIDLTLDTAEISFDYTWGRRDKARLPAVDPWPAFKDALALRENWGSVLPGGRDLLEILAPVKKAAANETPPLLLHPGGRLEVRQQVAPLGLTLSKVGNAPVAGHNKLEISGIAIGAQELGEPTQLEGFFARGQYQELSAAEKLSAASFEKLPAGVTSGAVDVVRLEGAIQGRQKAYESFCIRSDGTILSAADAATGPQGRIGRAIRQATAERRVQKSAHPSVRFAGPRVLEGLIAQERFDVASGETLAPLGAATKLTRSGALQVLNTHLRTNPSARGHVGIVELEEDVA